MSAPNVLTQQILTQRSAQPVVLIQSEEILRTRTPAYSATTSDLSFMVRQPSASAILRNSPEILLELKFTLDSAATVRQSWNSGKTGITFKYNVKDEDHGDYGFMPEMLPLQNKCIRNMVISINGASQSVRCNEYGKPYCLMHCSREYMEKIGGGINDFKHPMIFNKKLNGDVVNAAVKDLYAENASDCLQYQRWKAQMLQDNSGTTDGFTGTTTPIFQFREPLYVGCFGAFQNCESFPAWSCEQQKSAGILHCHNLQIQCAMEENWERSLYLGVQCYTKTGGMASVTGVTIKKAELLCEWVQPPPRMVGSAIGQQVSYATSDVLRFVGDFKGSSQGGADDDIMHEGDTGHFQLNAVSFPYMPNVFLFEIAPHYAHKSPYIGMKTSNSRALWNYKKDARMCITHMDLTINTSNQVVPFKGATGAQTVRLNAYELYKMTLENVFSIERYPYSFQEWLECACFVALTPAQLNGVLNSPSIRGNVVVQGQIYVKNMCGMPLNCGKQNKNWETDWAQAGVYYEASKPMERMQCIISGIYSNRQLTLDSKSGLISENTFSQAFAQSLRLGSGGQ
jgi:hypothetical protein